MVMMEHNFGRHVPWGTRRILVVLFLQLFGDTEIGERSISLLIKNYILRFNIPMDDHSLVHVLQSKNDSSHQKSHLCFSELVFFGQVVSQISSLFDIHDQI